MSATSRPAATAATAADDELQLLRAQVAQWREHGRKLSDVVRELQAELQEQRDANAHMGQLLRAQEEKIVLLEQLAGAAGMPLHQCQLVRFQPT